MEVQKKMNYKDYIKEMKKSFKSAKSWSKWQLAGYFESYEEEAIDKIDNRYVQELKDCKTWQQAEDIANRYII